MSRRRGEFEHRTSIFEGSYRAWSFLGGIDPEHLFTKTSEELDPLSNPIAPADDTRVKSNATSTQGRPEYPYEPLPRSGLAHPFVQAILSPWLGPDADQDAITLGLTTLRTWWQHRRKGESGSAIAALSTEKMQGIVDGYTRHFFTLAHCLVVNDKEQPPRTLHTKMKAREKQRRKGGAGATSGIAAAMGLDSMSESERSRHLDLSGSQSQLNNTELTPLERLHAAQQKHYKESEQFGEASITSSFVSANINLKGKCVPGKVDLGSMVDSVNRHAAQLAHRGNEVSSSVNSRGFCLAPTNDTRNAIVQYGDPRMTPIVLCNTQGDCQIAMSVDGITCSHCVRIVETVLKGCNGNRSPISGLLDAAADRAMNSVIIKIERPADAKRIAFQAARNLAMVGYTAKALEVKISDENDQPFAQEAICQAFQATAKGDAPAVFDWGRCCSCPDNGVERRDCPRHSQMEPTMLNAFVDRGLQVAAFLKMPATRSIEIFKDPLLRVHDKQATTGTVQPMSGVGLSHMETLAVAAAGSAHMPTYVSVPSDREALLRQSFPRASYSRRNSRNPSIMSFGNGLHQAPMASETTFGRAMSGLSALSIDWENLDDFDLEVDHSAHINNQGRANGGDGQNDNAAHAVGV